MNDIFPQWLSKTPYSKLRNSQYLILFKNPRDAKQIEIERSHRLGGFQKEKKRPIVTKFLKFKDKENIKKASYKLKGTTFGTSDQFPNEINEKTDSRPRIRRN